VIFNKFNGVLVRFICYGIKSNSYGGFLKWGYPNSWMVYNGKSIYKWMILEVPSFKPPPYVDNV
jgi:hypothetical protein